MKDLEKRFIKVDLAQLRARKNDKGGSELTGYASVFNSLSENLGGFREIIKPGAFTETLRQGADVRALINHDPNLILARSTSEAGTLTLKEDEVGLKCSISMPDVSYARDLMVSIERRDVTGMSFGFYCNQDNWREERDGIVREVVKADLFDVSVVTYPAYAATTINSRAFDNYKATKSADLAQAALALQTAANRRRLALRGIEL